MYAAAEEQQWRAAQGLNLVEEQGLHFPPMVSQHLWMFLQKRIISIANKMWVGINLMAVQHLYQTNSWNAQLTSFSYKELID